MLHIDPPPQTWNRPTNCTNMLALKKWQKSLEITIGLAQQENSTTIFAAFVAFSMSASFLPLAPPTHTNTTSTPLRNTFDNEGPRTSFVLKILTHLGLYLKLNGFKFYKIPRSPSKHWTLNIEHFGICTVLTWTRRSATESGVSSLCSSSSLPAPLSITITWKHRW